MISALTRAALGARACTSRRIRRITNLASRTFSTTPTRGSEGEDDVGTSESGQERALLHYCMGLRQVLSKHGDDGGADSLARNREGIVRACEELRRTLPVKYDYRFMSSGLLMHAFEFELERARSANELAEYVNIASQCADIGLVPLHSVRNTYVRVREVLESHGAATAIDTLLNCAGKRVEQQNPTRVEDVTPWTLTRNDPNLDAKIVTACMDVKNRGFAIIDGALGFPSADAVRVALEKHAERTKTQFTKGELDQSERHVIGDAAVDKIRDDSITWLTGDEMMFDGGLVGAFAQFMRVTMLNPLHLALGGDKVLAPVDSYISNTMLSVYEPGARGFVAHVDNMGPHVDPRALTAIYYPMSSAPSDGGALALFPDDPKRLVRITPTADRLVLFASARVPHAVEARCLDAKSTRLAASFWYIGNPNAVITRAGAA